MRCTCMKKKAGWVAGLDLAGDAWAGPREGKKMELGKERAAGCLGHETKPRPSLKEGKEAPG